jgi:hypothetical protein
MKDSGPQAILTIRIISAFLCLFFFFLSLFSFLALALLQTFPHVLFPRIPITRYSVKTLPHNTYTHTFFFFPFFSLEHSSCLASSRLGK